MTYLDFSGFLKLDSNTRMQFIGDYAGPVASDERFDPIITVAVWRSLPAEFRDKYILEDFAAAVRDAEDIEFDQLKIVD